jgi:hypothetical protein
VSAEAMGPFSEVVAHGGAAGAAIELLTVIAIIVVFAAVWLRERSARKGRPMPERQDEE